MRKLILSLLIVTLVCVIMVYFSTPILAEKKLDDISTEELKKRLDQG